MSIAIAQNQMTIARFESACPRLDRWGSGSNPRFLRRRSRQAWRKRCLSADTGLVLSPKVSASRRKTSDVSLVRQGLEAGLFGAYLIVFLACLWMLG